MKRFSLFSTLLILFLFTMNAQGQWTNHSSFDNSINDLYVFDNDLYICGSFFEREDNACRWFTHYDGNSFDDHAPSVGGSGLRGMASFQGNLYATGHLQIPNTDVYKWDGDDWVSPFGAGGHNYASIFSDENEVYIGSGSGVLSKKTSNSFFYEIYDFEMPWDGIYAINKYDGDLIVGGWIESWDLNNIAIWKNNCILPLGEGVSGIVRCMTVFQSELYVGGEFEMAGGVSAKFIAKWNGTNWSAVGGSVTGLGEYGIRDMVVHNDQLYVVGDFNEIGDVAANNVAMWDGNNWHSLNFGDEADLVRCVEIYNNQLFIGADITDELSQLYSTDLIVTNTEIIEKNRIVDLYPNPVIDFLQITMDEIVEPTKIEIFNSDGQLILTETSISGGSSIACSDWTKGLYVMVLRDSKTGEVVESKRFFKS